MFLNFIRYLPSIPSISSNFPLPSNSPRPLFPSLGSSTSKSLMFPLSSHMSSILSFQFSMPPFTHIFHPSFYVFHFPGSSTVVHSPPSPSPFVFPFLSLYIFFLFYFPQPSLPPTSMTAVPGVLIYLLYITQIPQYSKWNNFVSFEPVFMGP